ncbi:hypothetical protein BGZ83_011695 [Gryganskiella cystojenkinii]|nr:hypothetical protein BGZ83_011695 [Gryganskiella cystojenkinii]
MPGASLPRLHFSRSWSRPTAKFKHHKDEEHSIVPFLHFVTQGVYHKPLKTTTIGEFHKEISTRMFSPDVQHKDIPSPRNWPLARRHDHSPEKTLAL